MPHRLVILFIGAGVGCTFPSPDFQSGDTGTSDTSVVDATDSSAAIDTREPPDTRPADSNDPCDKDRDGFKAKGGTCGGNDCDDDDDRASPSVSTYLTFDATGKGHAGDWNCDGTVKRQFEINVSCGLLGGGACSSTKGFTGNPTCGTSGKYVQCVTSGALCVEGTTTTQIQGCY